MFHLFQALPDCVEGLRSPLQDLRSPQSVDSGCPISPTSAVHRGASKCPTENINQSMSPDQDYYSMTPSHKSAEGVQQQLYKKGHNEDYSYSQQAHQCANDADQITTDPVPLMDQRPKDEKLFFKVDHQDNYPVHEIVGSVLDALSATTTTNNNSQSDLQDNDRSKEKEGCASSSNISSVERPEKKTDVKKYDERELDAVLKSVSDEFETLEFKKRSEAIKKDDRSPPPPKMIRLEFCLEESGDDNEETGPAVNTPQVSRKLPFPGKCNNISGGQRDKQTRRSAGDGVKLPSVSRSVSSNFNPNRSDKSMKSAQHHSMTTTPSQRESAATMLSDRRDDVTHYTCTACGQHGFTDQAGLTSHVSLQNQSLYDHHPEEQNVTARWKASSAELSCFLTHFGYSMKVAGTKLARQVECLACPDTHSFVIGVGGVAEMHRHVALSHNLEEKFCIFCDRRVADMADHLRTFANVHLARILALSPFKCGQGGMEEEMKGDDTSSDKSVVAVRSQFCCQACGSRHEPDLRMPDWLSRQLCLGCLSRMTVDTREKELVLCSFCNQGKYGYRTVIPDSLSKHNKNFVCVGCHTIMATYRRKILHLSPNEGSRNNEINEGTNVKECYENFRRMLDNLVSVLLFSHFKCHYLVAGERRAAWK